MSKRKPYSKLLSVGDKLINRAGKTFTVLEYIDAKNVRVRFDESGYEDFYRSGSVVRGRIEDRSHYVTAGNKFTIKDGYVATVVSTSGQVNALVELDDEFLTRLVVQIKNLRSGSIRNPNKRLYSGVGYIGQGTHKTSYEGEMCKYFVVWSAMLERCYTKTERYKAYNDCSVAEVWHCFQNFAEWAKNQNYQDGWHLDKDIIVKRNREYGPHTCAFVPRDVNLVVCTGRSNRGEYPLGVHLEKKSGKYVAQCSVKTESGRVTRKYLGRFNTAAEAFLCYKNFKELQIKAVANKYKSLIDDRIYRALLSWEVEEND